MNDLKPRMCTECQDSYNRWLDAPKPHIATVSGADWLNTKRSQLALIKNTCLTNHQEN